MKVNDRLTMCTISSSSFIPTFPFATPTFTVMVRASPLLNKVAMRLTTILKRTLTRNTKTTLRYPRIYTSTIIGGAPRRGSSKTTYRAPFQRPVLAAGECLGFSIYCSHYIQQVPSLWPQPPERTLPDYGVKGDKFLRRTWQGKVLNERGGGTRCESSLEHNLQQFCTLVWEAHARATWYKFFQEVVVN